VLVELAGYGGCKNFLLPGSSDPGIRDIIINFVGFAP